MLDMGFLLDIRRILRALPVDRQTLMFSAIMASEIRQLAGDILRDPVPILIGGPQRPASGIVHSVYPVAQDRKTALLTTLIKQQQWRSVLVFVKRKVDADRLAAHHPRRRARDQHPFRPPPGGSHRGARGVRRGEYPVMVATDVAARGIDVEGISHVVNYDVPSRPTTTSIAADGRRAPSGRRGADVRRSRGGRRCCPSRRRSARRCRGSSCRTSTTACTSTCRVRSMRTSAADAAAGAAPAARQPGRGRRSTDTGTRHRDRRLVGERRRRRIPRRDHERRGGRCRPAKRRRRRRAGRPDPRPRYPPNETTMVVAAVFAATIASATPSPARVNVLVLKEHGVGGAASRRAISTASSRSPLAIRLGRRRARPVPHDPRRRRVLHPRREAALRHSLVGGVPGVSSEVPARGRRHRGRRAPAASSIRSASPPPTSRAASVRRWRPTTPTTPFRRARRPGRSSCSATSSSSRRNGRSRRSRSADRRGRLRARRRRRRWRSSRTSRAPRASGRSGRAASSRR